MHDLCDEIIEDKFKYIKALMLKAIITGQESITIDDSFWLNMYTTTNPELITWARPLFTKLYTIVDKEGFYVFYEFTDELELLSLKLVQQVSNRRPFIGFKPHIRTNSIS